jgi:transposase
MSTDAPLQIDPAALPNDPAVLKTLVAQLVASLGERDARIAKLERHMDLLVRRLYGRTSEKLDPRQLSLFEGALFEGALFEGTPEESPAAEALMAAAAESALPEASSVTPSRRGHGRRPKPDTLRRVDRVYDLTDAEKQSLAGDGELVPLGEEVTEQYEWEPSCLYVVRHIQKKYVRRPQRLESGEAPHEKNVIVAAKPPQPIPGGVAGPGLLAHVLVSRFADHLPYHRQEDILARYGLSFSRQTTCGWALSLAELATPLVQVAIDEILASRVLHTDDTPVKVRDAHQKLERTGRFWTYVGDDAHPLIVFQYTPNRSRDGPTAFLKNFRGYLQADAFGGYDGIYTGSGGAIVEVACWAHARRKFFENRATDRLRAETALAHIGQLYKLERDLKNRCGDEWRELPRAERFARVATERHAQARPLLGKFLEWLTAESPKLVPKNPIRQAMEYVLGNWQALCRYAEDGALDIDNNEAERALRGIAIGRKNWLFCGSDRGGQAAAVHFSLIASCRRHQLDPFVYLRNLFTRLPAAKPSDLRELLPDRWKAR